MIEECLLRFSDKIQTGKIIDNRYQVLNRLGDGWFGKVFLCFDYKCKNLVALKSLKEKFFTNRLKYFLAEINILVNLRLREEKLKIAHLLDFNLFG